MRTQRMSDQRLWPRRSNSGEVSWRCGEREPFRLGWLLESSINSFAFAFRGDERPTPGTILQVRRPGEAGSDAADQTVVRRFIVAHDNLCIVAAEHLDIHPFPPAAAAAQVCDVEMKHAEPPCRAPIALAA